MLWAIEMLPKRYFSCFFFSIFMLAGNAVSEVAGEKKVKEMVNLNSNLKQAYTNDEYFFPEKGILSDNFGDRFEVLNRSHSRGYANNWAIVTNEYSYRCKSYKDRLSIGELKKTVVFASEDLKLVNDKNRTEYGKDTGYFESCNYLNDKDVFFGELLSLVFSGIWPEEDVLLEWPGTDAYVEVKDFILLIHYYPNDDGLKGDDGWVSAVYIDKETQASANRANKNIFGDLNLRWLFGHL